MLRPFGGVSSLNLGHLVRFVRGGFLWFWTLFGGLPERCLARHPRNRGTQFANESGDQSREWHYPRSRLHQLRIEIGRPANFELDRMQSIRRRAMRIEHETPGIGSIVSDHPALCFKVSITLAHQSCIA